MDIRSLFILQYYHYLFIYLLFKFFQFQPSSALTTLDSVSFLCILILSLPFEQFLTF